MNDGGLIVGGCWVNNSNKYIIYYVLLVASVCFCFRGVVCDGLMRDYAACASYTIYSVRFYAYNFRGLCTLRLSTIVVIIIIIVAHKRTFTNCNIELVAL